MPTQPNPDNSKDISKPKKEQGSTDLTGAKKRTEVAQDSEPPRQGELVERESPEVNSERDPRVN